jgi:hypothetical protein
MTETKTELNPAYFNYPTEEETELAEKHQEQARENEVVFKETYQQLLKDVSEVAILFKNGKMARLTPKDPIFGWFIRWKIKDLLTQVIIPKKLGFSQYGFRPEWNHQLGWTLWGDEANPKHHWVEV